MSEFEDGVGLAEAKNRLSALTNEANETGKPFIIYKNKRPWVEVRPLDVRKQVDGGISIRPVRHEIEIPDISKLFESYDGSFQPEEDGFANPVGREEL